MFKDFVTSIIRTIVPVIVGAIVTFLVGQGVELDDTFEAQLYNVLFVAFTSAYYIIARFLEVKFPQLGWLLGSPKQPEYTDKR